MMHAVFEILIAVLAALARFVSRNARPLFALAVGAGVGLALGLSLARFGDVSKGMVLLAVVIGALVVAPEVISYLNRLKPGK
jgi:hypothetical protein